MTATRLLAGTEIQFTPPGDNGTSLHIGRIGGTGFGTLNANDITSGEQALKIVTGVISAIIGFMTICAAIWFIFMFLIGGYTWMTSFGDKQRLQEARDRIVNALIGLVIVVGGWAILALVGQFFGFDTVIQSPKIMINMIMFKSSP
jgi:hypothetical protein